VWDVLDKGNRPKHPTSILLFEKVPKGVLLEKGIRDDFNGTTKN
jgi:hypothetical protein